MKKRGQITLFIIIALVIFIIMGFYLYLSKYSVAKKIAANVKESSEVSNADTVKAYAESCLKLVSEDALFNRIGLQGGYIDTNGNTKYKETGVPNPPPATFLGKPTPYYLEATCISFECAFKENMPSLELIKEKLSNYIIVEFEKCFNANIFDDIGLEVTKPLSNTKVNANFNEEDISVNLEYPIIIARGDTETALDSFTVTLPIRLKALHDSAVKLVAKAKSTQPNEYDITQDCGIYDKNGLTNVYVKNNDNGLREIIQLVDFSTYNERYLKSFVFQFAVKNVKVEGSCTG